MHGEGWIGNWSPGIGDPSIAGWVTVVAYFVCAWACWSARARELAGAPEGTSPPTARVWLALSIGLAALGVNKQLDLQSALTAAGKLMAKQQGWYAERDGVQFVFILFVLLLTIAACTWMVRTARGNSRRLAPALIGSGLLLAFVCIRATSFHWMDEFIGYELLGLRMNWIMELGGIALIGGGALAYRPVSIDADESGQ